MKKAETIRPMTANDLFLGNYLLQGRRVQIPTFIKDDVQHYGMGTIQQVSSYSAAILVRSDLKWMHDSWFSYTQLGIC